jgi:hypothetical protein
MSASGIAELIVIDVGYPESFVWRLYYLGSGDDNTEYDVLSKSRS